MGKFEVYTDKRGEFRFRLKAGNGQTILTSEGYKAKASCENGIDSVRTNSGNDARFERLTAKSGKPFFNLKASNGQVVGSSQTYSSQKAMENGIESVKTNAVKARIVEL